MASAKLRTLLLFAEEHAVQLTEQAGAHGSVVVLSSGKNALGYKAGFVQDGHMTVGIHISVPMTEMVDSSNL